MVSHISRIALISRRLDVPVAHGTDIDHAMKVINRVGSELAEDENWKSTNPRSPSGTQGE